LLIFEGLIIHLQSGTTTLDIPRRKFYCKTPNWLTRLRFNWVGIKYIALQLYIYKMFNCNAFFLCVGTHNLVENLYFEYWPDWRKMDTIHLLINHRSYMDPNSTIVEFDETNIQTYNYTFGYMCRNVLRRVKPLLK
jgi:hypothetical protein